MLPRFRCPCIRDADGAGDPGGAARLSKASDPAPGRKDLGQQIEVGIEAIQPLDDIELAVSDGEQVLLVVRVAVG